MYIKCARFIVTQNISIYHAAIDSPRRKKDTANYLPTGAPTAIYIFTFDKLDGF